MESLIQFNEGDKPSDARCFFCNKEAPFIFGIINISNKIIDISKPKEDVYKLDAVYLCTSHAEAFNSLLSGEHDINNLIDIMKTTTQRKINLRR